MENKKKLGFPEYITLSFYAAFLSLPFLFLGGTNIADGFRCTFETFPTNYLLYLSPALLYFFIRKSDIEAKEKIFYLATFDSTLIVIMHRALQTNRDNIFLTLVAVIMLCTICININETTANITLLSGLLVLKSPAAYIFSVYIPVLFLILMYTAAKKDKKKSGFLAVTYIYIPVLVLILTLSKKITIYTQPHTFTFSNTDAVAEFISGFMLIIAGFILFCVRALPVLRTGTFTEKLSISLFAIYPVILTILNCFYLITSTQYMHTILLSLVIYIAGNIQLSVSYGNTAKPVIPEKFNNYIFIFAALTIFCTFSFK